jgi:hypothetical protein
MDWIERWWGVSPDGGDGSLEVALTLLAIATAVAIVLVFSQRGRSGLLRLVGTIVPRLLRRL